MQKTDSDNKRSMPELPKVIIASVGTVGPKQTYDNVSICENCSNESTPIFFNRIREEEKGNYYLFLPGQTILTHENSLKYMVERLSTYPFFGGIYSDMYIKQKYLHYNYLPAYDRNVLRTNIIINSPILFKKDCKPVFHPDIKVLHFYNIMIVNQHLFSFCHIAEPLFTIEHKNQPDITYDMKLIKPE